MSLVTINGKSYTVPDGKAISIEDGKLYVDGQPYGESFAKTLVEIVLTGTTLSSLSVDNGSVRCQDVAGDVRCNGSVTAENVTGHVVVGGSVSCGNVSGDVKAGGSVKCNDVSGKVSAGGSVSRS